MICNNCNREIGSASVCPYCQTVMLKPPQPHHLPSDFIIGGKYRIQGVLGEGGFGITYFGYNDSLGLPVAIKEYFPHNFSYRSTTGSYEVFVSSDDTEDLFIHCRNSFLNEAKMLVKFSGEPGIVTVMDFIEQNNTAYLIMEYLDGITLHQYIKQCGTMSAEQTFALLEPVMKTLEKIHAAGIIHRDISPDNIMWLRSGRLKLMDFGAAREYFDENRTMSVVLKKGFAPVEQYRRNGEQGPWTDVYALCATIYRCITGTVPEDAIDRMAEDHLLLPSSLGAQISPAAESVLLYGLAVSKEDRCQSMTEMLALIERAKHDPQNMYLVGDKGFADRDARASSEKRVAAKPRVSGKKLLVPILSATAAVLVIVLTVIIIKAFSKQPAIQTNSQISIKESSAPTTAAAPSEKAANQKAEGVAKETEETDGKGDAKTNNDSLASVANGGGASASSAVETSVAASVTVPDEMNRLLSKGEIKLNELEKLGCHQLVTVDSSGSSCEIRFFDCDDDTWTEDDGLQCSGYVGKDGVSTDIYEGCLATPRGIHPVGDAFYIGSKPDTGLSSFEITDNTYWVTDPDSKYYNRHVEATGNMDWSAAEHMIEYEDYRCGFVVDYNTEAAYNAGSAIFFRIGSRSTAGGIAASQRDVEGFLRRLDKRKTPYILIV